MKIADIDKKYENLVNYYMRNGWDKIPSSPSHITFDRTYFQEMAHQDLMKLGCIVRIIEVQTRMVTGDEMIIYTMMFNGDAEEFLKDPRKFGEEDFTRMQELRYYYLGCDRKGSWWGESYNEAMHAELKRSARRAIREGAAYI